MPATCELCGAWLPQHQTSCPRNGVHPSQWTYRADPFDEYITHQEQHATCLIDVNEECTTGIPSSGDELLVPRTV